MLLGKMLRIILDSIAMDIRETIRLDKKRIFDQWALPY